MDKLIRPLRRKMLFLGLSIQQRLPLLICILLLSMMIIFGLISYFSVRESALKSGQDRVIALRDQLANMLTQSSQSFVSATGRISEAEAVKVYTTSRGTIAPEAASVELRKLMVDSSSVSVEILDVQKNQLLHVFRHPKDSQINFKNLIPSNVNLDTGTVGNFYKYRDSLYYASIVAVVTENKIQGFLLRWRLLRNSPRAVAQLTQLMGTQAKFYIGNNDNSAWTDMVSEVGNPLPDDRKTEGDREEYTNREGVRVMASVKTIRNTPWSLLLEIPEQSVLQSAKDFLKWVIIVGSLLVIIGMFAAWRISRNITKPLNELTMAASTIASGNYNTLVEVDRKDEVGKLSRAFNAMTAQVNKAKMELEEKILESETMNEELRNLSAHLQNIREEERIHIAREMHDELGQFLTGLKMDIAWLNKRLGVDREQAGNREKLVEMTQLVDEAVIFVRKLAAELRPSILDDLGLVATLEWHSKEFQRRFNIQIQFSTRVDELVTSELIATGLFRMYQESLTNVARHSEANRVKVLLQLVDDQIQLIVNDNGKGFDTTNSAKGKTLGLLGMKERATMIGGKLEITSELGIGTTVYITVPLQKVNIKKRVFS